MPIDVAPPDPRGRVRPIAVPLVLVLVLLGALSLPSHAGAAAGDPVLDPEEHAMCQQINAYRASKGLGALKLSVRLTKAAKWMSANMATYDYFDHSDSFGRSTFARIRSFGYRTSGTGENLAGGEAGAQATFSQWKNDAPHRAILLQRKLKVIGIGRAYSADSMLGWYWTTTFGATVDRTVPC